jgi:hypothetical protein
VHALEFNLKFNLRNWYFQGLPMLLEGLGSLGPPGVARGLSVLGSLGPPGRRSGPERARFSGPPGRRSGPERARFSGPPARPLNALPRLFGYLWARYPENAARAQAHSLLCPLSTDE